MFRAATVYSLAKSNSSIENIHAAVTTSFAPLTGLFSTQITAIQPLSRRSLRPTARRPVSTDRPPTCCSRVVATRYSTTNRLGGLDTRELLVARPGGTGECVCFRLVFVRFPLASGGTLTSSSAQLVSPSVSPFASRTLPPPSSASRRRELWICRKTKALKSNPAPPATVKGSLLYFSHPTGGFHSLSLRRSITRRIPV
ncbi:unnamed protein product [Acanthosepion pharaonis]|uniref:Uncharacterized protein n=1 Tax=Acanthosepion pharaonis TaxID=158019 RepID=A0A812CQ23_ACAPH|nr:unnamed protein product [Sepia pharaonis]